MNETVNLISNYGIMVVVCGMFFWQYFKQQSRNEKREEKLYDVIDAMSKTLPEIKTQLNEIASDIREVKTDGRC